VLRRPFPLRKRLSFSWISASIRIVDQPSNYRLNSYWQHSELDFLLVSLVSVGMRALHFLAIASILLSVSCASHKNEVDVRTYHLKDIKRVTRENKVVRAEQQKRLRGAISRSEMEAREGLYYMVDWSLSQHAVTDPIRVVFKYHQAATGAKELKMVENFAQSETKGNCEFAIIGERYQKKGRVLVWRVEVFSGAKLLASEQSYLWE